VANSENVAISGQCLAWKTWEVGISCLNSLNVVGGPDILWSALCRCKQTGVDCCDVLWTFAALQFPYIANNRRLYTLAHKKVEHTMVYADPACNQTLLETISLHLCS